MRPLTVAPTQVETPTLVRDRWVETLSHLAPEYGGVTAAVPQLARMLIEQQAFTIDVVSFTETDETEHVEGAPGLSVTHWPANRSTWLFARALRKRLQDFIVRAQGLHLHGLWETHTSVVCRMARTLEIPYVLSAHGMLDPWALANKGWKKRLYSLLIERRNIEGAACLHALTMAEAEDYRRYGSRRPIAVIPNGIDLPRSVDPSLFLSLHPNVRGKRIVLFLGRIHFKKGLDILVEAWSKVHLNFSDAVLVLAGPDSENSRAAIEQMIARVGVTESVVFAGMLDEALKWSALAVAHAFVLPSYSEGFSVAVLEAMGMGVPVIVSRACHVPEVESFSAGWEIEPNISALIEALDALLGNAAATNAEIGNRGRRLVRARFSSAVVTQQMADLYRWVQGGPRPSCFPLLEVAA